MTGSRVLRALAVASAACALLARVASADPARKIAELELSLLGVSATVDPAAPTVPKNIASAVRVVVRAGTNELSIADVARFVGADFEVQAELSGPGLRETITLPQRAPGDPLPADPLLLGLPAMAVAGDYTLSNVRLMAGGRTVLDASPPRVPIKVFDQILVTSVKTRPLTLDEIKEKGIVLDSDDYLGFEFTLGLKLESKPVNFSFPVVFDRNGVAVPQPALPPPAPVREGISLPTIVPLLLEAEAPPSAGGGPRPKVRLTLPNGDPIRIPSVLVIPGNVGYLKQFFSAQLFVANGAPISSGLVVRDVSGTIKLPAGADHELGTDDDPLALPETVNGAQPETLPVRGEGLDGEPGTGDDIDAFAPAQQGQAEFLLRGEREGFHTIDFDIRAVLEGLPVGPVDITGKASGGVLVRNPFFDVSFTVPSVVRKAERFKFFVTVTNIGQGIGNDVNVTLDASRISGARLVEPDDGTLRIDTLRPGDARTLEFVFESERTGQVVASYLRFDSSGGASGDLRFTLGVGERGVPLSPDTLALPASTDGLPSSVVDAAMRVLGQAWSIANAPAGTLPRGVARISKTIATEKALALAEAGLRTTLGQSASDAVRDLLLDWYGGQPLDAGFDQLLRQASAGHDFARAAGTALADGASTAGGATAYEEALAQVAASGPDFVSFAVTGGSSVGDVVLIDGSGRRSHSAAPGEQLPESAVPGAVMTAVETPGAQAVLGLLTAPTTSPCTIEILGREAGSADLSATFPRGDGSFVRVLTMGVLVGAGSRTKLTLDLARPDALVLEEDQDGDGTFESQRPLRATRLTTEGPVLVSANVIGPETLAGATPFGLQAALLFDRAVDAESAARKDSYSIPANAVRAAKRQLSGRFVFVSLERPEGPYAETSLTVTGMKDTRGVVGQDATLPLGSRVQDAGAVVSGRVLTADGLPVAGAVIVHRNNPNWDTCEPYDPSGSGVAQMSAGPDGRYEFRYVRQDTCGDRWEMVTQDPGTAARRSVSGFVRTPGEQLVLDIVMFGRGSVSGIVRELTGAPVAGATVTAVSGTDPQVGGTALTDIDGRYRIDDITVGPVSVMAGKGVALGRSSGRIDRAGNVATVNVTIDGGAVKVSGVVRKLEGGRLSTVPNVQVVFSIVVPGSTVPAGVTTTDRDGRYALEGMPAGAFKVEAALNRRDRGFFSGIAAAGENVQADLTVEVPLPAELATLRGVVRSQDGAGTAGVIVSVDGRGVLSGDDGGFEIPGIVVRPNQPQTVFARSRDGLRFATAQFTASQPGDLPEQVVLTLSGLGAVGFQVLDESGNPVSGQEVAVLSSPRGQGCIDPCGCDAKKTDADGFVRYEDLPLGQVSVQAAREGTGFVDVARGTASVTRNGDGFAVLRFAGAGVVKGTVLDPDGKPVFGADVALTSQAFLNDGFQFCGLQTMVSHRARTDQQGRFRFTGVNIGAVGITASQAFFPTSVGARGTLSAAGQTIDFTLRLANTTSGELSGVVFLPDGETPAGAGVEVTAAGLLPDVVVQTNSEGRYRFARIFPEGTYTLTARDPVTGGVSRERIYLRAAQDLAHDFRLKGKGTVRVRVVDGADQPVTSATVRLTETEFPGRVQEGAVEPANQGVATFENVFEGSVSVEASDAFARGGRASSTVPRPGSMVEVKVRLTTTGRVEGRFLMRDRTTPIPFGVVRLIAGGRVIGQTTTLGSVDVGAFAFDHVPAGPVRLEAQDPLTARLGIALGSILVQDEVLTLDVIAQGLGAVQGLVTSNGEPQPGAHVDVVSGSHKACTFADASGRYVVDGVPEGAVVVTASLDQGFLSGTASDELAGDGSSLTIDVALRGSGTVEGQVMRPDGVTPGPVSVVSLRAGGAGGGTQSTTTDGEGRFRFSKVPAGVAMLSVDVLGSIDRGSSSVEVPAGAAVQAVVRLIGLGRVRVTVRDAGDGLVAGANVTVLSLGDTEAFSGVTGADGTALVPEVFAGNLRVTAFDPVRGLRGEGARGPLSDGGEAEVAVRLEPAGRVSGRVFRHGGAPAPGLKVVLRGIRTATSGPDGSFVFDNVTLGPFGLSVHDPATGDHGAASGTLLDPATPVAKDITLNGIGAVHVEVRDASNVPAAQVDVEVLGSSAFGGFYRGVTDLEGRLTLPNVLAGGVTVRAFDGVRRIGGSATATVPAGGGVDVAVGLEPVAVVHGRVLAPNGRDGVAGAVVTVKGRTGVSGDDGSYEVPNVPQGGTSTATIIASLRERVRAVADVDLGTGSVEKDLILVPAGTVRGVVRTAQGELAARQPVAVQCLEGLASSYFGGHFTATTNDLGAYSIADVPACTFRVSATNAVRERAEAPGAVLADGQVVTVNLTFLPHSVTLPQWLTDGNQQLWQIGADGAASPGPHSLFGGGAPRLTLLRNGSAATFVGSGPQAASEEDKREIVVRQDGVVGLTVTRKVFVPPLGYFVRYLEVLENAGAEAVTVDVVEEASLSRGVMEVVETSSGDAQPEGSDRWFVLDDSQDKDIYTHPAQAPPLAVVAGAAGHRVSPVLSVSAVSGVASRLTYGWNGVVVPAGGRVALLHLLSVQADRARAQASDQRLASLPPELLEGMTPEEAAEIANFTVPPDLRSAVDPLPPNDGRVSGRVLAGDAITPIEPWEVTLRSRSPYYGAPISAEVLADGRFLVRPHTGIWPDLVPRVVPRASFDLTAKAEGHRVAAAEGDFPSSGRIDITSLAGRTLRASSAYLLASRPAAPELAADGDTRTEYRWATGDAASAPFFRQPWLEVGFPAPVTVEEIRLRGSRDPGLDRKVRRARFELRDGQDEILWSREVELPAPARDIDLEVPAVAGVRAVRMVDVADATDSPAIAELQVLGQANAGPTGRVDVDVVYAGTGLVDGRVLRDGSGVFFALVELTGGTAPLSTRSLADGRFRFEIVDPGSYTLTAQPSAVDPGITISAGVSVASGARIVQDLVAPPLGSLQGALRLVDGQPAGATLTITDGQEFSRTTFGFGSYTLPDLRPGAYLVTAAEQQSRLAITQPVTVTAGPPATLDFDFPPFGLAKVRATLNGAPLGGATVEWRSDARGPDWIAAGLTDFQGRLDIRGIPASTFHVRVFYPRSSVLHREATASLSAQNEELPLAIDLPAATVGGLVRRADGSPAPGAAVDIVPQGTLAATVNTDASGHYSFDLPPSGTVVIRAYDNFIRVGSPIEVRGELPDAGSSLALDAQLPGLLAFAGDRDLYRVTIPPGTGAGLTVTVSLYGRVLGTHLALNDPHLEVYDSAGALVAESDDSSGSGKNSQVQVVSAAGGVYSVVARGVAAARGAYDLDVVARDQGSATDGGYFNGYVPLVRDAGIVAGTVSRRDTSAPLDGQRVRLVASAHSTTRSAVTDAGGGFSIAGVPPGDWTLGALDPGGDVIASATGTMPAGGERQTQDLVASIHAPVTVTVRRGSLNLAGIAVTLESSDAAAPADDRVRTRMTDASGSASTYLPIGTITARATDPDTGASFDVSGTLAEGTPLSLSLVFGDRLGTIRGTVTAQDGSGVPGATVTLFSIGRQTNVGLQPTDARGAYRFDGLVADTYVVSTTVAESRASSGEIAISGNDRTVDLAVSVHIVKGRVTEPDGAGAVATLQACAYDDSFSYRCVTTTSAEDGTYGFYGLPNWRGPFYAPYVVSVPLTATLTDGSYLSVTEYFTYQRFDRTPIVVNLVLPASGSVSGTVRDAGGQPVAEASVQLQGWSYRTGTTDAAGRYSFGHVRPGFVRVRAADANGIPGEASGEVVAGAELALDVSLVPTATLSGALLDADGTERYLTVEVLEMPGGVWNTSVATAPADGSFSVHVPAGLFRVIFEGDGDWSVCRFTGSAAAEGSLAADEQRNVILNRGSHARLPLLLSGPMGSYGLESSCGEPVVGAPFVESTVENVDPYPQVVAPELDGRAFRTLLAAGAGVRIRHQTFVPASGAFSRTLTLLTNPGTAPVTVRLDSQLQVQGFDWSILATADGNESFDSADSYAIARHGGGTENDVAFVVGGALAAESAELGVDSSYQQRFWTSHAITIQPGQTRGFLAFSVARPPADEPALRAQVVSLADLSDPEALAGLTPEERGAIVNFNLGAPVPRRLEGVVRDAAGNPVAGARVGVLDDASNLVAETMTDGQGQYRFEGVPPGDYRVLAMDAANFLGTSNVAIGAGQTLADVTLPPAGDTFSVEVHGVLEATGAAAAGIAVRVEAEGYGGFWSVELTLDEAGHGVVSGVPPGRLFISTGTSPDAGWETGVAAAGAVMLDIELRIGSRFPFPIDLTDANAVPYFARPESGVEPSGIGPDWDCDPFCTGYSDFSDSVATYSHYPRPLGLLTQGGREVSQGPDAAGAVRLTRRTFVPLDGRFVRVLDILRNTSSTPITLGYYTEQAHRSAAGAWTVDTTSSDDPGGFDSADHYVTMIGPDPASPAMAWVIGGPGAAVTGTDTYTTSSGEWTWFASLGEVTVPAGGQAILMRFAVRRPAGDTAGARGQAASLASLSDDLALAGLTDQERAAIVNFAVPQQP